MIDIEKTLVAQHASTEQSIQSNDWMAFSQEHKVMRRWQKATVKLQDSIEKQMNMVFGLPDCSLQMDDFEQMMMAQWVPSDLQHWEQVDLCIADPEERDKWKNIGW